MTPVVRRFLVITIVILAGFPAVAAAQGGGISGVVRDTSGAVLPGVTVEASSPVLIEKVRTVTTDDQGRYNMADLRTGTYAVTFTLPGFATVRREGIEISLGFIATINADLRVGAVEETITVSGAPPIVDMQSVVRQTVLSREVIDTLPTAKNWWSMALLIPGTTGLCNCGPAPDVGGTNSEASAPMRIHGGLRGDMMVQLDGMLWGLPGNNGYSAISASMNESSVQEMVLQVGAISAEAAGGTGGVRINLVPKEGGNTFSGQIAGNFANDKLQGSNYTSELAARGLDAPDSLYRVWDESAAFGGPIVRNRVWFYSGQRWWGSEVRRANTFFAKDPLAFVFEPDRSGTPHEKRTGGTSTEPLDAYPSVSLNLRTTWQVTPRNRIGLFYNRHFRHHDNFGISQTTATDAATSEQHRRVYLASATYSAPVTNRVLVEAGTLVSMSAFRSTANSLTAALPTTYSARELSTNVTFRSRPTLTFSDSQLVSSRASVSYVTGAHTFKTGMTHITALSRQQVAANGDAQLVLLNGVPNSVLVRATPWERINELPADFGLYAQDQWALGRMTLNLGVRFDYNHQSVPAQTTPGGTYVGPRSFEAVETAASFKDIGPRVGVAYDLFGNGRTAVKASFSRYLGGEATGAADRLNPINSSINQATRQWTDRNGDYIPQESELGPLNNVNFGRVVPSIVYADETRIGWGVRKFNWLFSASVQHELTPRLSVDVAYNRRSWGNFDQTDNLAVTPADFDPFCVTAPVDTRLPDGGGYQICGLYDVKPAKFGQADQHVVKADNFGEISQIYDGVDVNVNMRLGARAFAAGGVSTGRERASFCAPIDNPGQFSLPATDGGGGLRLSRFCEVTPPFQPNIKANGGYALPWGDVQLSVTFQSIPGPEITAQRAVPNAQIAPSLGRNLSAGANATVSVELIEPGTRYGDRMTTTDFRVAKNFQVVNKQLQVMMDLYNLFNANPVVALNTTYGPAWLRPLATMQARFVKFGLRFSF